LSLLNVRFDAAVVIVVPAAIVSIIFRAVDVTVIGGAAIDPIDVIGADDPLMPLVLVSLLFHSRWRC